jgi:hypothetical protein
MSNDIRKEPSKTERIYEFLAERAEVVGTVITFEEMTVAVGFDVRGSFGLFRNAQRRLLERNRRALKSERGVGYRVVAATDHEALAYRHQLRSARQIELARATIEFARVDELPEHVRPVYRSLVVAYQELETRLHYMEVETAKNTKAIRAHGRQIHGTQEQVAQVEKDMQGQLDRLKRNLQDRYGMALD